MAEKGTKPASALDNAIWGHKWGFADTSFRIHQDGAVEMIGSRYDLSGYKMYDFLPYVEEVLDIKLDLEETLQEVASKPIHTPHRNEAFCEALKDQFKDDQVSFDDKDRLLHSHGQTTTDEVFRVLYTQLDRCADMVFYCESEDDAAKLVQLAKRHNVCLVPFGGGTSVSCALKLPQAETRMIVSVDMQRMNRIEWIDRENLRACVQAGIRGSDLERQLMESGFVSGHEPDSIELSTLGGWIATNASGMKKNRYGNIEEIVENMTLVTPEGIMEQIASMPRTSVGMQPRDLLFGCEGNLGLITKAVIKIHPVPEATEYGSLVFPDIQLGTDFLRALARTSFVPASIRLVDNIQFRFGLALKGKSSGLKALLDRFKKAYLLKVKGFDPDQMVAATIVMEGSLDEVAYQRKGLYRLARKFQGIPAGAEAGKRGYMLTYAIAYIRDFLAAYHIIGETFETSVPWSKISQVCAAVKKRAEERHREFGLPGKSYVSYRITQVYHTGVCIYFTYGVCSKGVENPDLVFGEIERSLREAIIANGGSISHHHGVGKLRKDFMKDTFSPASIDFLKKVKKAADPQNIFGIRNNVFAD